MSKFIKTKLNANDLMGVSSGLGFLSGKKVEEITVPIMWDVVEAVGNVKPHEENIQELGKKINQEFYENHETPEGKTERRFIKGKEEAFDKANKELGNKEFEIMLPRFQAKDIEKIKGITGRELIGLKPIITR